MVESWTLIKLGLSLIGGVIVCLFLNACGAKIGNTVIGSSGFLEQHGINQEIMLYGRRIREQVEGRVDDATSDLLRTSKDLRGVRP